MSLMNGVPATAKTRDSVWNENVLLALAKPCPVDNMAGVISENLWGWVKRENMEDCPLSSFLGLPSSSCHSFPK